MAHAYKAIQWTPFKKSFDFFLAVGVIAFVAIFVTTAFASFPGQHVAMIQIFIRAFGAAAFALLTLILAIGPLARLSVRFLPLLYNRRHLGVTCFGLALAHGALVLFWYHGFSSVNPFISLLISNPRYTSIQGFPFESLGLLALLLLFVLAATSHDFWNKNLGPGLWKAIHMSGYLAYALIVGHVLFGAVQDEKGLAYAGAVGASAVLVASLQVLTGHREARRDRLIETPNSEGWLRVANASEIPDGRAKIIMPPRGERIAVFSHAGNIYAVSNVCRHQGGPLGEGPVIDGCVTCPWHGFQFRLSDGRAPAPYADRVATYRTCVIDGVVFVHPTPAAADDAVASLPVVT